MISDRYDVVVVGGGPAGTVAARFAALGGASVLLLEKDRDLGIPVRCAEAVGRKTLNAYIDPDPSWIAHELNGVCFIAPDGTRVDVATNDVGYILHRRLFDHELGRLAAESGAQIQTRAYVYGLKMESGVVMGVRVKFPHGEREIGARIVIGADGVESRVGRWAGMRTHHALKDIAVCYQMTLGGVPFETSRVHCYFGEDVAPGGYAWVFPKGTHTANVGLGITGDQGNGITAKRYLERFVERHFPKASALACVAGGVPAAKPFKKIHGAGFLLAGDAAVHSNPLTGGGITSAMAAGKLAGEVSARCIAGGSCGEKDLAQYTRDWEKRWGDEQRRFYRIKEVVHKLKDDTLNQAAHILVKLPPEKRRLKGIFRITLAHNPKILLDVAKSFL
jgi:digeranylgeranylglycerophospholipid reductase